MRGFEDLFLIAEVGGNHEGSYAEARKLLRMAIDAGASSVKFQVYTGNTLVNEREDPQRVRHFDRFALKPEQYLDLARECRDLGGDFSASIWDISQLDMLDDYLTFYKIGSGDLTCFQLIEELARRGKPIVLSTGLSYMSDIKKTVDFILATNSIYAEAHMLCIMQCTSMYPIPDNDANLSVIGSLREEFDCAIGYSDHTVGCVAAPAAVALGASCIEVHFTDTRVDKVFRDHFVSMTPSEFASFKGAAETIQNLLGDGTKKPMPSEIESQHVVSFRRSVYPRNDIPKGKIIERKDLVSLRPMKGICASKINAIIGKTAARDLSKLQVISDDDFC